MSRDMSRTPSGQLVYRMTEARVGGASCLTAIPDNCELHARQETPANGRMLTGTRFAYAPRTGGGKRNNTMNTKFVRFAGAASVLIGGSVALLLPGCATPMDMDSPGTDGVATVAENSEETGSTSQALTKWQAACAASVTTDYVWCYNQVNDMCLIGANMPFSGPSGISDADCRDMARKQCDPGKDKASLACATTSATIYRVHANGWGRHTETKVPGWITVEASYTFSLWPIAGADSRPIRRCRMPSYGDFLSLSPDCEGKASISGIEGYSYAPTTAGARAVYRCRVGDDHFISTRSDCEGKIREGLIGYAK